MVRYKIIIEYDGTSYCGWQVQKKQPSIQQSIQEAVYLFCQTEVHVYGAGRTDAGVHAFGQVAHFDLPQERSPYEIRSALNFYLKAKGVVILSVEIVPNDFHARFSATQREYKYYILNRETPSALIAYRAWHVIPKLDVEAIHSGAQFLVGEHDFTSFRAVRCQSKSPCKTITHFSVSKKEELIELHICAYSFLHNQVRIMVGNLMEVGVGDKYPQDIKTILQAKDRRVSGRTAPAHGLFFAKVHYS